MTFAVRIDFGTTRGRGAVARDEIDALLAELRRTGQVLGDWVVVHGRRGWCAFVRLPARDAWHPRLGVDGAAPWAEIERQFGRRPRVHHLGPTGDPAPIALRACRRLLLWSTFLDRERPVRDFATGRPVPPHTFTGDRMLRQGLVGWAHEFANCDDLWMGCGVLERPAWRELSRPDSVLGRHARRLASAVEAVTSLPTYRLVMRYHALPHGEANRPCPQCGGRWARRRHGAFGFTFRCDPCRLVSYTGTGTTAPARV